MKFTLKIELGNAAMQTMDEIKEAIKESLSNSGGDALKGIYHSIRDANGNIVGKWEVK